jgi:alkaline phosphatase D
VPFTGYNKVDSLFNFSYQDWWLGYPDDRKEVVNALKEAKNKPIILTGDHHRSMVMGLFNDDLGPCEPFYTTGYREEKPLAWEILVPSITSQNHDVYQEDIVKDYTKKILDEDNNPHIRFADLSSHGFVIMHFTPKEVSAEYIFMNTIKRVDSTVSKKHVFKLNY